MATDPSVTAEESHSQVFSMSPRNSLLCPILVLKMKERSGQTGEGHREDHENNQRAGQWGQ